MAHEELIEAEGEVVEALPNTMFRVKIEKSAPEQIRGKILLCTLCGKMRMYRISVMPGDRAKIEVSPYDLTRGRITYRYK